jgi:hypothetical protein
MRQSRRHRFYVVCLLLVLLPLQGIAAAAGLRMKNECPMMAEMTMSQHISHAQAGDCCGGDQQLSHTAHASHGEHGEHAKKAVSCDMGMQCPVLSVLAMPSIASLHSFEAGGTRLIASSEPNYISHIPEGLQRPPRLRA